MMPSVVKQKYVQQGGQLYRISRLVSLFATAKIIWHGYGYDQIQGLGWRY
jgi:hypothetical protein